jgi:uncharacterized protein YceH (UPF0502 family)
MSEPTPSASSDSPAASSASRVAFTPRERRVLGVLVEKAKTTPEYYPMTIAAIVTACNQKSNRDPVTNYDSDDVEDTLQGLRKKGVTILVEAGGRVPRWKHTLYEWLKVSKVELAVLAELLLRGPQTEGELRSRASRMEPIAELSELQTLLEGLASRDLVTYLTPSGQRRGAIVSHTLYSAEEFEKVRRAFASRAMAEDDATPSRASTARAELTTAAQSPGWTEEVASLRAEIDSLRTQVESLSEELRELKSALGV